MYKQMNHTQLIADNVSHYVELVSKLLSDDVFWNEQHQLVAAKFRDNIHQNNLVAKEWLEFLKRAIDTLYMRI